MALSVPQKSAVFSTYNALKASGSVESGRLNRALGLVQKQEERPYETTHESCTCPDWVYRVQYKGGQCKHQAQLLLSEVAEQAEPEDEPDPEPEPDDDPAGDGGRMSIDEINESLGFGGW